MAESTTRYTAAIGRRKTASARVRLTPADKMSVTVNGMPAKDYFKTTERTGITEDAFKAGEWKTNYSVSALVKGGGLNAQAISVRHAISRALTEAEEGSRPALKALGFLKRDPRAVERKKPGLRKARKSPQWSKR
jgi:small subunit ribosomal protein S9